MQADGIQPTASHMLKFLQPYACTPDQQGEIDFLREKVSVQDKFRTLLQGGQYFQPMLPQPQLAGDRSIYQQMGDLARSIYKTCVGPH